MPGLPTIPKIPVPRMNYANMIEEKNLKKTFILATLVSTIIGTFTTGLGLYERVGARRKQKKTDNNQDTRIKELEEQVKKGESKSKKPKEIEEGQVKDSLGASGPMIKREYDRDFARLGERFARGDAITQNQLQGQVITLQSTVIGLLEDALYTGRIADINKLYNASELAREGSIAALQDQYQRILQAAPLRRPPMSDMRRISSTPTLATGKPQLPALQKQKTLPPASTKGAMTVYDKSNHADDLDIDGPLFCRYSSELQGDGNLQLHGSFGPQGANQCPACQVKLSIEQGRAWKIIKEILHERISTPEYDDEIIEERTYLIGNRFVIKSHRGNGGYACLLCFRNRDKDTLLESPQGLVRHVWQKHTVEEYNDSDIKEVGAVEKFRGWDHSLPGHHSAALAAMAKAYEDRIKGKRQLRITQYPPSVDSNYGRVEMHGKGSHDCGEHHDVVYRVAQKVDSGVHHVAHKIDNVGHEVAHKVQRKVHFG